MSRNRGEGLRVDEVVSLGRRRRGDDHGVRLGEHGVESVAGEELVDELRSVAGAGAAPQPEGAAAERAGTRGDRLADPAEADDRDGRAGEGSTVGTLERVVVLVGVGLPEALRPQRPTLRPPTCRRRRRRRVDSRTGMFL